MAQIAAATFGMGSIPFFIVQAATACVLLLAANTAFNGFPLLGSVLARDGYAPKALNTRGDRLVFSNGMIILGLAAIVVLVVYQANLTTLIQLYIIGVFVSFSLGQIGMVRHWRRELRQTSRVEARRDPRAAAERRAALTGLAINSTGAAMRISSSCSGTKSFARISNCVGPIFLTPVPQKLTSASGLPLSTTRRKSPIGVAQLLAVGGRWQTSEPSQFHAT